MPTICLYQCPVSANSCRVGEMKRSSFLKPVYISSNARHFSNQCIFLQTLIWLEDKAPASCNQRLPFFSSVSLLGTLTFWKTKRLSFFPVSILFKLSLCWKTKRLPFFVPVSILFKSSPCLKTIRLPFLLNQCTYSSKSRLLKKTERSTFFKSVPIISSIS